MYGCEIVYANGNQTNVVLGIRPVLYQESDQYYIGNETQHCIGNETSVVLEMQPAWYSAVFMASFITLYYVISVLRVVERWYVVMVKAA